MRLYTIGYGHHPSGKVYTYLGTNNFRTGQRVVVPVTNKWTKTTYNTMGTIMRTQGADGSIAGREAQRLSQKGIGLKSKKGTDTLNDLPSGRIIKELGGTKKDWEEMSDVAYEQKLQMRRDRLMKMEF